MDFDVFRNGGGDAFVTSFRPDSEAISQSAVGLRLAFSRSLPLDATDDGMSTGSTGICTGDSTGLNSVRLRNRWFMREGSVTGSSVGGDDLMPDIGSRGIRPEGRPRRFAVDIDETTGVPDHVSDKESRALGTATVATLLLNEGGSRGLRRGESCMSEPPSVIRDISGGRETPVTVGTSCLVVRGLRSRGGVVVSGRR